MSDLYVLDNFHAYPEEVREHALSAEYVDWLGPDGQVYKRICITELPLVEHMLTDMFGEVQILGMGYRLNFNQEPPNAAIHSDLGWGTHALVWYLSDGPSGTAFWRHKVTGRDRILPGDQELFEKVCNDWNDESAWEMIHKVDMKFNRALVYKSALFHSRHPFEAFGTSPETGRLIGVAFFNMR
jgi:hypothetical protein